MNSTGQCCKDVNYHYALGDPYSDVKVEKATLREQTSLWVPDSPFPFQIEYWFLSLIRFIDILNIFQHVQLVGNIGCQNPSLFSIEDKQNHWEFIVYSLTVASYTSVCIKLLSVWNHSSMVEFVGSQKGTWLLFGGFTA